MGGGVGGVGSVLLWATPVPAAVAAARPLVLANSQQLPPRPFVRHEADDLAAALVCPVGGSLSAHPPRPAAAARLRCWGSQGALCSLPSPRCLAAASPSPPPPASGGTPGEESESRAAFHASPTAFATAEAETVAAAAAESLDGSQLRDLLLEMYGTYDDVTNGH